jgi:mRNA-degrading endonuclease RelE of RelBE toxin-antitoxin system
MFSIKLTKDSQTFLKGLEPKRYKQVLEKIHGLQEDPHPQASKALKAYKGYFRLRVGDYRAVYSVTGREVEIFVVDNRGDDEVYNRLERLL